MYRELRARIDDVGCVHCISTVHSCDVRRVLYGNHGSRISLKILLREIPPITHYINMIFAALILAFTWYGELLHYIVTYFDLCNPK